VQDRPNGTVSIIAFLTCWIYEEENEKAINYGIFVTRL